MKITCPHCLKKFEHDSVLESKLKRQKLILKYVKEEVGAERLFKRVRRFGYRMGRRAFQDDLKRLKSLKLIKLDIHVGGYTGSHTIVKPLTKLIR